MAEKTKLKWLRKEFSSSEELEYYLAQLTHQDKLKSDIISLLGRFQHLLFASYEPDFLTITYNGQWDVNFGTTVGEPAAGEQAKAKRIRNVVESSSPKGASKKSSKLSSESSDSSKSKRVSSRHKYVKPLQKVRRDRRQSSRVPAPLRRIA